MTSKTTTPGVLRFSVAYFLCALALLMFVSPFVEGLTNGPLIESLLMSLVLLTGAVAVGHQRHTRFIALALVAPALAGAWLNHWWPAEMPRAVFLCPGALAVAFIMLQLFRFILTAPGVNSEVLCAAVANYIMLGLLFAFAYALAETFNPNAFIFQTPEITGHSMRGYSSIYFSFVTLTTLGYGDIVPATNVVRMLTIMESTAGLFYMAILIARLVSLHSASDKNEE